MNFFGENFTYIVTAVGVAMVGGVANWLMREDHTIFQFVVAVFLAGFAGFLVGELCIEAKISESWAFFFCGTAGLSAEVVLKLLRKYGLKKLSKLTGEELTDFIQPLKKDKKGNEEE